MTARLKANVDLFNDQPISVKKHDRLGRKRFAEELASRIKACRGKASVVIAITGEWGCGKTSVKNMVVESLPRTGKSPVTVLEFNPWQFSGHASLTDAFFEELAKSFRLQTSAASKKVADQLGAYSTMLTLGGGAVKILKKLAAFWDSSFSDIPDSAIDFAVDGSSKILKAGEEAARAKASERASLTDFKNSLARDIGALPKPLVVIIDDIDRLTTAEIREVFRLVKSNADFPNTVYVLMFDRNVVAEALDEITGNRGYPFLEKITQAIYPVPHPRLDEIHRVLGEEIEKIFCSTQKQKSRWEEARWAESWPTGLRPYFENLRNVYRFLNSLEFHASQLKDEGVMEFNPVDLIALEVFRLFEPSLYEALPRNRARLVGNSMESMATMLLSEKEKSLDREAKIANLLSFASRKEPAKVLIEALFPNFFREDDNEVEMHKRLRVGTSRFFDRYFTLSLSDFEIPQRKLDQLLAAIGNPAVFRELCLSINKAGITPQTFERLDAYHSDIPKKAFPSAVQSLADVGDFLPSEEWLTARYTDPLVVCWRILHFSLLKVRKSEERFEFLKNGFSDSEGVRLVVYATTREDRRASNQDRDFLISETESEELKKIALLKIQNGLEHERLRDLPNLNFVLWRWSEWESLEVVKNWISRQLNDASDALWFLRTIRGSMSIGTHIYRYVDLEQVERFSKADQLQALTKDIEISTLAGDDYHALTGFRASLQWKKDGRPASYRGEDELEGNPIVSNR